METSPPPPPNPASRFRFRDHNNDVENGESVVGYTTSESSSISSEEDSEIESDELTSMTAKGINHLCLELIELKQASEMDFQENIISNYLSFIRIFKETEGINNEVMKLKNHLMAQKQLVRELTDGAYLKILSNDPMDQIIEKHVLDDQDPTTLFKIRADEVLETLDTLIFEQRLDEAFVILETEDGNSQKVKFQEDISPDVWMCYKAAMAERRVMLADKLTMVADNTRVSAAELQKSLLGLSRIGFDRLATRLLLKYYHTRIAQGVNDLKPSKNFYVRDLAKYVFSMISQAAKSFVVLHGETSPCDLDLTKWACEETEVFANCFNIHVTSISEVSGGLSTVVDSVHFAISYCSLLEKQKLFLQPWLIEHILPFIEGILKIHFDHFKKVISIFTSSDVWVVGRYLVSGMLTEGSYSMVFAQYPEYCLLTSSGRKFVSLLQAVIEDVSSLVSILGSSILERLMDLFTEYTFILEKALTNVIEGPSRINMAESPSQKASIIANLSMLEIFFSKVIRSVFKDVTHLKLEIDHHLASIEGNCSRLRTHFCEKLIHTLMSNEDPCFMDQIASNSLQNSMPSIPFQVLFLELRKVEELAEDSVIEFDWLTCLLTKLVETTFDWISRNFEIRKTSIDEDTSDEQSCRLTQFALDMQFLIEVARRGGYLSTNMINASRDLVLQMKSELVSAGFDQNRCVVDYEKITNSAIEAIKELNALENTEWDSDEEVKEYQLHSASEDDDTESSLEVSFEPEDNYTSTIASSHEIETTHSS